MLMTIVGTAWVLICRCGCCGIWISLLVLTFLLVLSVDGNDLHGHWQSVKVRIVAGDFVVHHLQRVAVALQRARSCNGRFGMQRRRPRQEGSVVLISDHVVMSRTNKQRKMARRNDEMTFGFYNLAQTQRDPFTFKTQRDGNSPLL